MNLARFPRRRYTAFATPIEPLPRFSAALAASCPDGRGPEVWVKRDDLLGLFPGGNKTRKLEFLVADALAQGADTLVTCGAPQSNHCRITLAAAVKEGLQCRFVIEERVAGSYDPHGSGNHFAVPPARRRVDHRRARPAPTWATAMAARGRSRSPPRAARPTSSPAAARTRSAASAMSPARRRCSSSASSRASSSTASSSARAARARTAGCSPASSADHVDTPILGIGVSRDPADQEPLVHREAQAVLDLLGIRLDGAARRGA